MNDSLERIWAGWRSAYVTRAHDSDDLRPVPDGDGTIFERILSSTLTDREAYVVWRGQHCAAMLNVYPYGTGHLMVMPQRAVADLGDLGDDEHRELWDGVRSAVAAVRAAYGPDGVNVGLNIGRAGGASIPDHIHVHVLPRWAADTTFLTTVAETRMMPEPLDLTWEKLTTAWPTGDL